MSKLIITALGNKELAGLYIGRPSILGNPFPTKNSNFRIDKIYTSAESMEKYREYLLNQIQDNQKIQKMFKTLKNRILHNQDIQLNCWCIKKEKNFIDYKDSKEIKCHGEIIIEILYHNIKKDLEYIEKNNHYLFKLPLSIKNKYKTNDKYIKILKENKEEIKKYKKIIDLYNQEI